MDFRRHRAAPAPLYINGDWRRSCWWPFTAPPSRVCWPTPSLCGMLATQWLTEKGCRGWWGQLTKRLALLCPPWMTSPALDASQEQEGSSATTSIPATTCSAYCPLVGGTGACRAEPTDWTTASFLGPSGHLTLIKHKTSNRHTYTSLSIKCNMLTAFYILCLVFTLPVLFLFQMFFCYFRNF